MLKVAIDFRFGIWFVHLKMKKFIYFLGLAIPIIFISCDSDNEEHNCDLTAQGVIRDYIGFDGCGFLIVNDSLTFEVLNWDEFNLIPEDGMEICFDYEVKLEEASICMMGEIIWLTDYHILE